jgi:hypothetical protein
MSADELPIHKYIDLATAAKSWGRPAKTQDEVLREVLNGKGANLVYGMLARWDSVLSEIADSVLEAYVEKLLSRWRRYREEHFDTQMEARISKHGPCPPELYRFLWWDLPCGPRTSRNLKHPTGFWIRPPPKGSDMRRTYDRWMKRKAPKKDSSPAT